MEEAWVVVKPLAEGVPEGHDPTYSHHWLDKQPKHITAAVIDDPCEGGVGCWCLGTSSGAPSAPSPFPQVPVRTTLLLTCPRPWA